MQTSDQGFIANCIRKGFILLQEESLSPAFRQFLVLWSAIYRLNELLSFQHQDASCKIWLNQTFTRCLRRVCSVFQSDLYFSLQRNSENVERIMQKNNFSNKSIDLAMHHLMVISRVRHQFNCHLYFSYFFKSFLMLQMTKMRSFKYLNQLAQSQQNSIVQAQETSYRESVRWKLKSVNQLALSDPCFLPHLPHEKALTSSTVNSSFKRTTKISLRTTINPESDGLSIRSSVKQMSHIASEQRFQREIINQRSSKVEEYAKGKQYCFDCDQIVQKTQDHQCHCHFAVLLDINMRLKDLCLTIATNQCEKLMILSDNSCQISQSKQMTMLISFLRHSSVYYNAFEMFLRKRLINLCCKKLALLLEEEDRQ